MLWCGPGKWWEEALVWGWESRGGGGCGPVKRRNHLKQMIIFYQLGGVKLGRDLDPLTGGFTLFCLLNHKFPDVPIQSVNPGE